MAELPHIKTKKFVKLRNKRALIREGPGYPRNGTPMGVFILALAHLVVKRTIQVKVRQNILLASYDAMPPYGGYWVKHQLPVTSTTETI